jgi:transposase
VYLSFYSPELNLIGQFRKALKNRVRRSELTDVETPSSRGVEGSEDVPAEHLQFHLAFHKAFS